MTHILGDPRQKSADTNYYNVLHGVHVVHKHKALVYIIPSVELDGLVGELNSTGGKATTIKARIWAPMSVEEKLIRSMQRSIKSSYFFNLRAMSMLQVG
jgi:hypothetical protein